jgi:hypothetical protein
MFALNVGNFLNGVRGVTRILFGLYKLFWDVIDLCFLEALESVVDFVCLFNSRFDAPDK